MNDLFSRSFKKNTDLKTQAYQDDVEAGRDHDNLDKFFEDVENVKAEMKTFEKLYKKLQEANAESETTHSAKTMKEFRSRMDLDVQQLLKRVKIIKGKLEALERSNAASLSIPGWGPGSSAGRTRTSVVSGLGKKLKDLMEKVKVFCRRQFRKKREVRFWIQYQKFKRDDAVRELEKNLLEPHQLFFEMAALVEAQGHQQNDIESHVAQANSFVRGTGQLQEARVLQESSRKWACYAIIAAIILVIVNLLPLMPHILVTTRGP